MAVNFVPVDRETPDWFAASVQEYLPEDHLARFVVEIVDQLDLSHLVSAYAGSGSRPYHPAMLVALLFYGYATGVFSGRKLAQATHDSIAFRYICANTHPDHRTIADFRKRFLDELAALFTQVLLVAQAMGLLKLGTVSLDGTKIHANASKHKALSWEHANRLEAQRKGEVDDLMRPFAKQGRAGRQPTAVRAAGHPAGAQATRAAAERHRRGQRGDRSPCAAALRGRAGRVRTQAGRAPSACRAYRQEAGRP